MLELLEALAALHDEGTMSRAGLRLRISQSAVSKRISTLEERLARRLIVKQGRRVELTPAACRLLERARPAAAALKAALREEDAGPEGRVVIALSESVLASWGAPLLARVREAWPEIVIEPHAHRSPAALERVAAGEALLAVVAGAKRPGRGLHGRLLVEEPMVVVPSGLEPLRVTGRRDIEIWGIEATALTRAAIDEPARRLRLKQVGSLESYFALVRWALAGFGHALVPLGVAQAVGIEESQLARLPKRGAARGLRRPIWLVGRPGGLARPAARAVAETIHAVMADGLPS